MLLVHTSDLLGRPEHYAALARALDSVSPDALVLGGNMFPDDPTRDPEEMGTRQPIYVLEVFRNWLNQALKAHPKMAVVSIFGHRDWLSSALAMEDLAKQTQPRLHILAHDRPFELRGLTFLGYSKSPPTDGYVKDFERLDLHGDRLPFLGGARWDPNRRRAIAGSAKVQFAQFPSIADDLEKLAVPAGPWVFAAHAPPFDTQLDRDYHREPIGSKAIKQTIERRQPLVSLHGHVTSSPDVTGACQQTIGSTTAVNVGQHAEGLCYAVIEIDVPGRRVVRVEAKRPQ